MKTDQQILQRFHELEERAAKVTYSVNTDGEQYLDKSKWFVWVEWSTSAGALLNALFGRDSVYVQNFNKVEFATWKWQFDKAIGVFKAAREDYEKGFVFSLSQSIAGELFGDFVSLAKRCLVEGQKDPASVLASAALEDALKRYASGSGIDVNDRTMQEVVNALKSKGLVGGAQKTMLDVMPRLRDYAMHGNWDKLKIEDVSSVIAFVEQFLKCHF